jgi:hypothetical protein
LVTTSWDKTARVWQVSDGKLLEQLASAVMVEIWRERRVGATGDESGAGAPR